MATDPTVPPARGDPAANTPPPPPPRTLSAYYGPPKELRPTAAAAGAVLLSVLAWTVWNQTSSRLALFVCMATLTALAVDLVWSQVATARLQLRVTANPSDAVVGDTVTLTVSASGRRQFVRLTLLTFQSGRAPVAVDVPASEELSGAAITRQLLTEVAVEVVGQGLSGLVACARRRNVPLARPLAVGPRPVPVDATFPELYPVKAEGGGRPSNTGDLVRGVRPYVPGDPRRWVHWRASARVGDLVVKEVEEAGAPRLVLVLNLGNGGMAAERAAGRAAWWALEALRRDYELVMATAEGKRLVIESARSWIDVNRRLAAAAPPGEPKVEVDGPTAGVLLITPQGDSWH